MFLETNMRLSLRYNTHKTYSFFTVFLPAMTWCARFLASCLPYGGTGRINCKQRWLDGGHACQDASRVETDGPLDKTLQTAGGGGVEAAKKPLFQTVQDESDK